jgi:hypothetical protein
MLKPVVGRAVVAGLARALKTPVDALKDTLTPDKVALTLEGIE